MKTEIQAEQIMMLRYLEFNGINVYDDNKKDNSITNDSELVHYNIAKNEVLTIDYDTLKSISEDFSEFNLDIDNLIDSSKSLRIVSNDIANVNKLLESLRNNIRVVSEEEIPDKHKLINKGKHTTITRKIYDSLTNVSNIFIICII